MIHDPNATLDYAVDWSGWLATGETITDVTWTVPDGLTQAAPAPSHDGRVCTIWLTGGTPPRPYTVSCHVTTSQGRQDERSIRLHAEHR